MSGGMEFDEKTSRKVESLYLTPDVIAQRCQVLKALVLDTIESERPYIKARVERANSMVDFVLLDRSMGLHNFEKASEMLEGALKLSKRAGKMR